MVIANEYLFTQISEIIFITVIWETVENYEKNYIEIVDSITFNNIIKTPYL